VVRILVYPDSSINLLNAVAPPSRPEPDGEQVVETADTSKKTSDTEKFLTIEDFTITNVKVEGDNRVIDHKSALHIDDLSATVSHRGKLSGLDLTGEITLAYYQSKEDTLFEGLSVQLAAALVYEGDAKMLTIDSSRLVFEGARFDVAGSVGLQGAGTIDLNISLTDRGFSLLSLAFREKVIEENLSRLSEGEFYGEGNLVGDSFHELPFFDLSFGVNNVSLQIPNTRRTISDLSFDAYVTSGQRKDLSEAQLKVDRFSAHLPGGRTKGSLTLQNLQKPFVDIDWYLRGDLSGFDDLFKIDAIDSLSGVLAVDVKSKGALDLESKRIIGDRTKADLVFEGVSLSVPGIIRLDNINGGLKRAGQDLQLENLHVLIGQTDLTLNGTVKNAMLLPFEIESDIVADLRIRSRVFDLPEVFAFDPSVGRSFDHVIRKLDLEVTATSTTSKMLYFDSFPAIDFAIDLLDASFDDFPDVSITNSRVDIYDDTSGFNIRFDPLNLRAARGELVLKGAYNGSARKPYSLVSATTARDIDMLDLLNQFEMELDSTSVFNMVVDGAFHAQLEFPKGPGLFERFRLAEADLTIHDRAEEDTVISQSLFVDVRDVDFDLDIHPNPMATLTTRGVIGAERFKTADVDVSDLRFDVSIQEGLYEITPTSEGFFRTPGFGVIILQPWSDIPTYRFTYRVEQFQIEDWLASFMEKPFLSGTMRFNIDIQLTGDDWENMIREFNGRMQCEGTNLQLLGVNVDEVLKKVERSQNFTLLDVGAVVFAGPVGLAVTKGLDVAALVTIDPGELTHIPQLVSNWEIENGKLLSEDVAFSTEKNRIAVTGHVNLPDTTLDVTIAVLNKDGTSSMSQAIGGNLYKPTLGEIKVVSAVLAPVTNLFKDILSIQGEVFYEGSVKHPGSEKTGG
jgi:AsmA protein